jgi:hypothetical protein
MGEPPTSTHCGDGCHGFGHRGIKRLVHVRSNCAQRVDLEFRPALFNEQQIRQVRRQVEDVGATRVDGGRYAGDVVRSQVVHHHGTARL